MPKQPTSSACLACHCAISTPFTGMRTIGVTGGTRPALAICARLSMYCRQSRRRPESHGLCSISNTQPSYFDALMPTAESTWAGAKQVSACWPASSARMTLFRLGKSAIFGSLAGTAAILTDRRPGLTMPRRAVASARHQPQQRRVSMIIDCHGHYTTEPKDLHRFRKEQTAAANAKDKAALPSRASLKMSDDEIRESIEQNQLKLQRERGTDLTIFSPRASGMGHHVRDESISLEWSQICNDLIHRVCALYPKNFIGVCQLPQSPGVPPKNAAAELERCVKELGFIGCNLNPDPSGGYFNAPPLTDKWWYPFYEKM